MSRTIQRYEKRKQARAPSARRIPRTRGELLPLEPKLAKQRVLVHYLAIEALRAGVAERSHLTVIDDAIFLAGEFGRVGYCVARPGLIDEAIGALQKCTMAQESGRFCTSESEYETFGEVLTLLDRQIEQVPVYVLAATEKRHDDVKRLPPLMLTPPAAPSD
jgi:hypothetical protein